MTTIGDGSGWRSCSLLFASFSMVAPEGQIMTRPKKSLSSLCFQLGDKARVKYGVTVPGFPDIPLGGWSGMLNEIVQSKDQITYEIEWDQRTLAGMHPVYRKRCERDGLDLETMWLGEADLEADDGTLVPMEQPTEIKIPPLSMKDEDDRIRAVFGLTHDDPLPEVTQETLVTYHRYLAANLKFPFTALYGEEEIGPFSSKRGTVIVTGLLDPEVDDLTEEDGVICTGRHREKEIDFPLSDIEVKRKDPNYNLISDYASWFS
jgi:hypothetical protein